MSIHRYAARRDKNEREIIDTLRRCGASVIQISAPGAPDLLVGFRGITHLVELKARNGKLTPAQLNWHRCWQGRQVQVIRSIEDALALLNNTLS